MKLFNLINIADPSVAMLQTPRANQMQIFAPRLLAACCVLESRSENSPGQKGSYALESKGEHTGCP